MKRAFFVLMSTFLFTACYHATITTGARPGPERIEERWASGWIYGLVPPATVETMMKCSQGVAQVETKLSFLNQLVSGLTFGIYTPMEIVVTCAEGRGEDLPVATSAEEWRTLMGSGEPFLFRW